MNAGVIVVCALVLCGGAFGDDDPLVDLIEELVYETNQYLQEHGLSEVKLPPLTIGPLRLEEGVFGNLSSIQLIGRPNMTQIDDGQGNTNYPFELNAGLEDLFFQQEYSLEFFLPLVSGTFELYVGKNALNAKGEVFTTDSTCTTIVHSVRLMQLDDITIKLRPMSIIHSIVEKMMIWPINIFNSYIFIGINMFLDNFVKTTLPNTDLSQLVCSKLGY